MYNTKLWTLKFKQKKKHWLISKNFPKTNNWNKTKKKEYESIQKMKLYPMDCNYSSELKLIRTPASTVRRRTWKTSFRKPHKENKRWPETHQASYVTRELKTIENDIEKAIKISKSRDMYKADVVNGVMAKTLTKYISMNSNEEN